MVPRDFSVAVTDAPEMTAPEASVTVPVILELTSCPNVFGVSEASVQATYGENQLLDASDTHVAS